MDEVPQNGRTIFQSTLPQGERLSKALIKMQLAVISIHAPTRGATERFPFISVRVVISIHAPTRGATL